MKRKLNEPVMFSKGVWYSGTLVLNKCLLTDLLAALEKVSRTVERILKPPARVG